MCLECVSNVTPNIKHGLVVLVRSGYRGDWEKKGVFILHNDFSLYLVSFSFLPQKRETEKARREMGIYNLQFTIKEDIKRLYTG